MTKSARRVTTPQRRASGAARRSRGSLNAPITVPRIWKFGGIAGGAFIGFYAVYVAWTGFGWWQPAGITYVDDHITKAVAPIAAKQDDQGISILSGRIEVLKASKQLQVGDRSRLDLSLRTTKDPIAIQIIQSQQKNIDDTIKGIDEQIASLTAQLQTKK